MNCRLHCAHRSLTSFAGIVLAVCVLTSTRLEAATRIEALTRAYDNQRTAANLLEKALKPSNVRKNHFGKLFMLPVDDQIYAGLLYAAKVPVSGAKHNVLYAATVNNTVYAFDADTLGAPLWYRNFNDNGRPTRNTEVGQSCKNGYKDFIGNIGIVGTPAIGPDRTMYFVTRTVEGNSTVQRLHAIDIATGNERPNSPKVIQATVPGTGEGSTNAVVAFNPETENQRPALALSGGTVYVGWASFCDTRPYHGWLMAYDAATLAQINVFNASPNGNMAGIWMSGAGPAFDDAGNMFFSTGNGTYNGATDFGESMVKLEAKSLRKVDSFTPSNFNTLNDFDLDFGTQGPTILPGSSFLIVGGKEGKMYLLDGRQLGGQAPGDIQIPQVVQAVDATIRPTASHHMHNAIPVWKGPQGTNAYVWGENDFLRLYRFDSVTQKFALPAVATGSILAPSGMPGGMMTISANGSRHGSGILWATLPRVGDANQMTVPGDLYAFDAESLTLLWSSQSPGDDPMNFAKGSPPIVVNGKVYVASLSNFVSVYGLRKRAPKSQNLALNAHASGSAPCIASQTPDKALNDSAHQGPTDKWCSSTANPFLQVDLGQARTVGRFVLEHAGAGGDDFTLNTRDFNIQVSADGTNFTTVANVADNVQSITTHDIPAATARYIRLNVLKPAEGTAPANIYEFQAFAPASLPPPAKDTSVAGDPPPVSQSGTPIPQPSQSNGAEKQGGAKVEVTSTGRVIAPPADVAAHPADAQVTASGLAMKVLKAGNGTVHPVANDCVTVRFIAWKTDGALFSTSTTMNDSDVLCLNAAILGISEALKEMVVGERRRLWVPQDLTFHEGHHHVEKRPEDEEPPHKDLTFDLELLSILKAPPTPADLAQPPNGAARTASGLAYHILQNGTGKVHPSTTSTVRLNFSGWKSDGKMFETTVMANHPAVISVATAPQGWRDALCSMVVGEKTRFWIPAARAFGEKPANRFDPAGDLVYEFELLSVQ